MNSEQIIQKQRSFFQKGHTLPLSFRLDALKRLYESIVKHEKEINQALKKDLEMDSVGNASGKGTANAQKAKRVADWVNKGGSAAAKWATNGSKVTGWESLFKLGTYSASNGHKAILAIGHFFGHQFKPWEAVNLAAKIGKAQKKGLGATAFNIVMNTGKDAGQTVFHFHTHVIPRYADGPAVAAWTPGVTTPEEMKETAEMIGQALS